MDETRYELTFYGRLVDGVSLERAQGNVVALFKASPEQVEKMFAGGRVVLRNNLDRATATKYVAVMRKNGLVCELESMAPDPSQGRSRITPTQPHVPKPVRPESASSPGRSGSMVTSTTASASQPDRALKAGLNLAGENVDTILRQSHLNLDPQGVRLSEHEDIEPPVFSELDSITVAPPGSDLADKQETVPVIVPDSSDISVAPVGSDMGQLKKAEPIDVPDLSHLKIDDID